MDTGLGGLDSLDDDLENLEVADDGKQSEIDVTPLVKYHESRPNTFLLVF